VEHSTANLLRTFSSILNGLKGMMAKDSLFQNVIIGAATVFAILFLSRSKRKLHYGYSTLGAHSLFKLYKNFYVEFYHWGSHDGSGDGNDSYFGFYGKIKLSINFDDTLISVFFDEIEKVGLNNGEVFYIVKKYKVFVGTKEFYAFLRDFDLALTQIDCNFSEGKNINSSVTPCSSVKRIKLKKFRPQHWFALVISTMLAFMLFGYGLSGPGFSNSEWALGLFPFIFLWKSWHQAALDKKTIQNGQQVLGSVEDKSSEYIIQYEFKGQRFEIKIAKGHILFPFKYYKHESLGDTQQVNLYVSEIGIKRQITILEQSFWSIES